MHFGQTSLRIIRGLHETIAAEQRTERELNSNRIRYQHSSQPKSTTKRNKCSLFVNFAQ